MRRRDLIVVASIAVTTGIIAFIIATAVFSPKRLSTKVPIVDKINSSFPDVKNDPAYSSFLNSKALDLTQPVQIGSNQNKAPFTKTLQ